ncbi:hypothetical protein C8J56DRAFT_1032296 [Mycena floridula]|nr:hypothetical protein C8J56DRAFT_1032296 [Mycena floridula]
MLWGFLQQTILESIAAVLVDPVVRPQCPGDRQAQAKQKSAWELTEGRTIKDSRHLKGKGSQRLRSNLQPGQLSVHQWLWNKSNGDWIADEKEQATFFDDGVLNFARMYEKQHFLKWQTQHIVTFIIINHRQTADATHFCPPVRPDQSSCFVQFDPGAGEKTKPNYIFWGLAPPPDPGETQVRLIRHSRFSCEEVGGWVQGTYSLRSSAQIQLTILDWDKLSSNDYIGDTHVDVGEGRMGCTKKGYDTHDVYAGLAVLDVDEFLTQHGRPQYYHGTIKSRLTYCIASAFASGDREACGGGWLQPSTWESEDVSGVHAGRSDVDSDKVDSEQQIRLHM